MVDSVLFYDLILHFIFVMTKVGYVPNHSIVKYVDCTSGVDQTMGPLRLPHLHPTGSITASHLSSFIKEDCQ